MSRALKDWARSIRRDTYAVVLAARDPRVPMLPKLIAVVIAAYALSPIDLIPDFIPVLGQLDDLVLLPLGILLVVRLIPADVMAEHRARAAAAMARPASRAAAVAIVAIWALLALAAGWLVWRRWHG